MRNRSRRLSSRHKKRYSKKYTKKHNRKHHRKTMRGGNYENDVTTRITEGIPTKPLNKIVVTVPGYGTMSGTAYKKLTEDIDRDGPDAFLK